ncbi:hypothetical protein [Marinomonas phage CPP1m]|uniref:N-acetyltransferase domain-containing protein n=2 Tax=Murciavirus CPP1m TaxID=2733327 RepID=A0A1W5S8T8_9CAUD|nr:acetyltransferase [Marinomonas phage CPP1m]ARB11249.1 hypothetical protein [Marinomonas phage CPP1m]ARB11299.1 hypothetical protein [Marinomonas phage CPG1g]
MYVRPATVMDILSLVSLADKYSSEVKNHDLFPVDFERLILQASASTLCDTSVILTCFKGKEPIGLLWGHMSKLPWSETPLAFDSILYVLPENRGSRAGLLLMEAWEDWAKEKGAAAVQISIASGIKEEATKRFFGKLGYSYIGSQYRKEC